MVGVVLPGTIHSYQGGKISGVASKWVFTTDTPSDETTGEERRKIVAGIQKSIKERKPPKIIDLSGQFTNAEMGE